MPHHHLLPPLPFALRTAGRALLVWFLARIVVTLFIHLLVPASEFDPLGLPERLVLAAVAVFVALHFARRRGELLLLGDLGIAPWTLAAAAAVAPLAAEAVLWIFLP